MTSRPDFLSELQTEINLIIKTSELMGRIPDMFFEEIGIGRDARKLQTMAALFLKERTSTIDLVLTLRKSKRNELFLLAFYAYNEECKAKPLDKGLASRLGVRLGELLFENQRLFLCIIKCELSQGILTSFYANIDTSVPMRSVFGRRNGILWIVVSGCLVLSRVDPSAYLRMILEVRYLFEPDFFSDFTKVILEDGIRFRLRCTFIPLNESMHVMMLLLSSGGMFDNAGERLDQAIQFIYSILSDEATNHIFSIARESFEMYHEKIRDIGWQRITSEGRSFMDLLEDVDMNIRHNFFMGHFELLNQTRKLLSFYGAIKYTKLLCDTDFFASGIPIDVISIMRGYLIKL